MKTGHSERGLQMLLVKIFFYLWYFVFQACVFTWPISLVLLALLLSEVEHAPKEWKCKHMLALTPLGLSAGLILYTSLAIVFPPLRVISHFIMLFGGGVVQLPQILMCLQLILAAVAIYKLKGHRCFFLSLLLCELWIGFWTSLIVSGILYRLH